MIFCHNPKSILLFRGIRYRFRLNCLVQNLRIEMVLPQNSDRRSLLGQNLAILTTLTLALLVLHEPLFF